MSTTVMLPLTEKQAQACGAAALSFGVETWEIAVLALAFKRQVQGANTDE